jgi:ABC-type antimicrobial peptide transport system ATPase subunit
MNAMISGTSISLARVYAPTAQVITIANALGENRAAMQRSMIALIYSLFQQGLASVYIFAHFYISIFPQCYLSSVLFGL